MSFIYVLKLQGNRYYVGKTNTPKKRLQEHVEGRGSSWTRLYPVIEMEHIRRSEGPFDEDTVTKEYMEKYGIDKVRGGTYVETELSNAQRSLLEQELRGAKDQCKRCGREGHFIKDCYAKKDTNGRAIDDESDEDEESDDESDDESDVCYRCGREGHYSTECYARTNHKGYAL